PDDPQAALTSARALVTLGRREEGRAALERCLELAPPGHPLHRAAAELRTRLDAEAREEGGH
ncbi:MAG: hypothetical protein KDD82_25760, partial [Planctomycetes bacterium]|nr:hypothetical protein [Planctomycetota bacterium]